MTHMISEMNPGIPGNNFSIPPKEGRVESQRSNKVNAYDGFAELAVRVRWAGRRCWAGGHGRPLLDAEAQGPILAREVDGARKACELSPKKNSSENRTPLLTCHARHRVCFYVLIREEGFCVVSVYDRFLVVFRPAVWFSERVLVAAETEHLNSDCW